MIKNLLAVLLFASVGGYAQQSDKTLKPAGDKAPDQKSLPDKTQAEAARSEAGCGPSGTQFDVKTDKKQHPSGQPDANKALVYVIEDVKKQSNYTVGNITTRVGLDGKWVGANRGTSYFFFSVDPGEHRLCSEWQSIFRTFSKLGAAMGFTAEAGKTYYFRTEVEHREEHAPGVKLEPIDSAEGQFLISAGALSTSHAKASTP